MSRTGKYNDYVQLMNDNQILASGAYSKVILVQSKRDNKKYAMKIVQKTFLLAKSATKLDMLRKEIEIHSNLNHPNIVKLHEWFEDKENFYLVLEYLNGGMLKKKMGRNVPKMSEKQVFDIFVQVCFGIEYLHTNRVIHRDIKAENIVLGPNGEVKICDFGWSCYNGDQNESQYPGTSIYMAPEIAHQKRHSYSADIWSLGTLLYEMINNKVPYANHEDYTNEKKVMDNLKSKLLSY